MLLQGHSSFRFSGKYILPLAANFMRFCALHDDVFGILFKDIDTSQSFIRSCLHCAASAAPSVAQLNSVGFLCLECKGDERKSEAGNCETKCNNVDDAVAEYGEQGQADSV